MVMMMVMMMEGEEWEMGKKEISGSPVENGT